MQSTRRTYVIHVRDGDGPAIVQEVRTGRRAQLRSLRDSVFQIETWLRDPGPNDEQRTGEGD